MKPDGHTQSFISILAVAMLLFLLGCFSSTVHAFELDEKTVTIKLKDEPTQIQFLLNFDIQNVLSAWMGRDLYVICGAVYGNSQDYTLIGETVKEDALSDGNYTSYQFYVPISQFNSAPVGKTPTKARCLAFAKKGSQCTALAGVEKGGAPYDIPQELQSVTCDDITLPAP